MYFAKHLDKTPGVLHACRESRHYAQSIYTRAFKIRGPDKDDDKNADNMIANRAYIWVKFEPTTVGLTASYYSSRLWWSYGFWFTVCG